MRHLTRKAYPLVVMGTLSVLIYLVSSAVPENEIRTLVEGAGVYGPIVIILLFWITNFLAPLSGSPILLTGMFLFGQQIIAYSLIATFIASITNFWASRLWGRDVVEKLAGSEELERIDQLTEDYGLRTLLILRLILWQYHDVVSYLFGLTKISFRQYLLISTLGTIPGAIFWWFLASRISSPILFSALTFVVAGFCLGGYLAWAKFTKRPKRAADTPGEERI